jgi:hypothetical protein
MNRFPCGSGSTQSNYFNLPRVLNVPEGRLAVNPGTFAGFDLDQSGLGRVVI